MREFFKIRNFTVYYGFGQMEKLKGFDAVILEPKGHKKEEITALKQAGAFVLAYYSVVELPYYHENFESLKTDVLQMNGKPVINKSFDTYYMNLKGVVWKTYLQDHAHSLLQDQGYDGLFLDTAGDLEDPVLNDDVITEQIRAYMEMLQSIRERFPQCILVQNNGIEHVAVFSKKYLNGICWENPSFDQRDKHWSKMILQKLKVYNKENHMKVLLLSDGGTDEKRMMKTAKRNKMLYCLTEKDYLGIQ